MPFNVEMHQQSSGTLLIMGKTHKILIFKRGQHPIHNKTAHGLNKYCHTKSKDRFLKES